MKKLLVVFVSVFFCFVVQGQKQWTLKECIDFAMQHNIDIKKLQLHQSVAAHNLSESKQALLPAANGFVNYDATTGLFITHEAQPFIDGSTSAGSTGLSLELDLFKGLYNYKNIQKQKLLSETSNLYLESIKNDVMLEVGTAFMYIIFNKEKQKTIEAQMQRTMQQLEVSKKLLAAGECTEADVLKLEVQYSTEDLQRVKIENETNSWILSLAQAMDVKTDTISEIQLGLEIPQIAENEILPETDSVFNLAMAIRPEVLAAKANIKVKEFDIALARSSALPSLSVGYNIYTNSSTPAFTDFISSASYEENMFDNFYGNFAARLSIPIFNKFTVKHELARKKIYKQEAEFELQNTNKALYNEIATANRNLTSSKKTYEMQAKILDLTNKTYFIAEKQNEVGEISSYDYLIEKNRLNETEIGLLIAKYEYLFHKMILGFYASNTINL